MTSTLCLPHAALSVKNMDLMQFFSKVQRNFRDYGFAVTLKKCFLYVFKKFFEKKAWFIIQVNVDIVNTLRKEESPFVIRLLQKDDYDVIRQIESLEEWLQGEVKKMLDHGGVCMVALGQDGLVGFYLAAFREYILPNTTVKILLKNNEVWGVQITVKKEYRGAELATYLRRSMYQEFKKRGVERVLGYVATHNEASLKSAKKVQAAVLGILKYSRVMGRTKMVYTKSTAGQTDGAAQAVQVISMSSRHNRLITFGSHML